MPGELFRRHVNGRTACILGAEPNQRIVEQPCYPKISNLHNPVAVDPDVGGAQISVKNSLPVSVIQCLSRGTENLQHLVKTQYAASAEYLLHASAVDVLAHHVLNLSSRFESQYPRDMQM